MCTIALSFLTVPYICLHSFYHHLLYQPEQLIPSLKFIIIRSRTGAEIRFHFWGGKRDGSRVRESLNRLVQRGRLGNITLVPTHLAITQEPSLYLQVKYVKFTLRFIWFSLLKTWISIILC